MQVSDQPQTMAPFPLGKQQIYIAEKSQTFTIIRLQMHCSHISVNQNLRRFENFYGTVVGKDIF
jgi:hypothetical protein